MLFFSLRFFSYCMAVKIDSLQGVVTRTRFHVSKIVARYCFHSTRFSYYFKEKQVIENEINY